MRISGRKRQRHRLRRFVVEVSVAGAVLQILGGAIQPSGAATATKTTPKRQAAIASGVQYDSQTGDPASAAARGVQALGLVHLAWQDVLPGWQIVFRGARKGYLAMTMTPERRIEVYVRQDRSIDAIAHDIAHELGHAVDVTYNGDSQRTQYLSLRGLDQRLTWWTCSGCTDLDVPAGDFAETFAQWAGPTYRNYSNLAPRPSQELVRTIAKAMYPGATADGDPASPGH